MKKRLRNLKSRMLDYGLPAFLVGGLAAYSTYTGLRQQCVAQDTLEDGMEKHLRDRRRFSTEESEDWLIMLRASHNVGHHFRLQMDKASYKDVMGAFKDAMKRTPAE